MANSTRGGEGMGLSAAIGAIIAAYFAYSWLVDAPTAADDHAAMYWYSADRAYKFALCAAAGLLVAALIAQFVGPRPAALSGMAGHGLAAITYAAMLLDTLLETGLHSVLTCALLAIVAFVSAQQAADLWLAWRRRPADTTLSEVDPHG
jgi:peptidoglycan/LPS O-acetylase OafA/YrhL